MHIDLSYLLRLASPNYKLPDGKSSKNFWGNMLHIYIIFAKTILNFESATVIVKNILPKLMCFKTNF